VWAKVTRSRRDRAEITNGSVTRGGDAQVSDPLRASLLACRLCQWLAQGVGTQLAEEREQRVSRDIRRDMHREMRAEMTILQLAAVRAMGDRLARRDNDESLFTTQALLYEKWAIDLLDEMNFDDARTHLMMVAKGWRDPVTKKRLPGRWARSVLDEAADSSELNAKCSLCKNFLQHRFCKQTISKAFCGEYPGSKVHLPARMPPPPPRDARDRDCLWHVF